MKKEEIDKQIKEEMENIGKGISGNLKNNEYQRELRMHYAPSRRKSLTIPNEDYPKDKNKFLKKIINRVRERARREGFNFEPEYNKEYFNLFSGFWLLVLAGKQNKIFSKTTSFFSMFVLLLVKPGSLPIRKV